MNNSLEDLGKLVASDDCLRRGYGQGGYGRVKKTEIIEMAIERIRHLQAELQGLYTCYCCPLFTLLLFDTDTDAPVNAQPHSRIVHVYSAILNLRLLKYKHSQP